MIKRVKTKTGKFYYFQNGKRISEVKGKTLLKRKSASKKKSIKKPVKIITRKNVGKKNYRKPTKKAQASWQKTQYIGKDMIIEGYQKEYPVDSGWVDSFEELLPYMVEATELLINDIRASDLKTKFGSFGYHFSVKYEDAKGVIHEFTNVGFTDRMNFSRKVDVFKMNFPDAFDDIADRFQGYLQREANTQVKLDYIIVEQLIRSKKVNNGKKKTKRK